MDNTLTKEQFYNLMTTFEPSMSFEQIHQRWLDCFKYMFKSFKVGFTDQSIENLFYNFRMLNGKMFWKEYNPDYKNHTQQQLLKSFCGECNYIGDRYSYDRIFRTHWLFLRVFEEELDRFIYPDLFKDE